MKTNYIKLLITNFILLSILFSLIDIGGCAPASPYPVKFTQPDNNTFYGYVRGDERSSYVETSDYVIKRDADKWWKYVTNDSQGNLVTTDYRVGIDDPETSGINNSTILQSDLNISLLDTHRDMRFSTGQNASIVGAIGDQECVVILVRFSNKNPDPTHTSSYYNNLLFSNANPKSMQSYYDEVSYGKMNLAGTVSNWYQSSETMEYYGEDGSGVGNDDKNTDIYELTREAVRLADNDIDFSQYDTNNDGFVDHVIIVHAGDDQSSSGNSEDIWSHRWGIPYGEPVDGIYVSEYTMQAESSPIGTFAHEFGHDLGLPDLYDRDYSSVGVGLWDLMGSGVWLDYGNTPSHLSVWCKYVLDWIDPTNVTSSKLGEQIGNIEENDNAYMLPGTLNRSSGSEDFFLVENRESIGFDTYLADGLLIWHIDPSKSDWHFWNDDENHKLVDLEEADGLNDLDLKENSGDIGDLWVNSANGFTGNSNPDSNLYNGNPSGVEVKNIGSAGPIMTIDLIRLGAPIANFTANKTSGIAPLGVKFTDTSGNSPMSWLWQFGDGTQNSTEQNPLHTFSAAGTYSVNLTAANEAGLNVSNSLTITVNAAPEPVLPKANFSSNVSEGYAPLTIQLNDSSENATFWNWNFGDGVTSIEQNPIHTFLKGGNYTVSLIASNENGTASKTATITVFPLANFIANPTSGYAPLNVQFTDRSQNATGWTWYFGDGATSYEQSPAHTYASAGIYTVNLTVSNGNSIASKTATITVSQANNGGGGGGGSSKSGGGGGGGSPEPASNVQVKELSQTQVTNGKPVKFDFTRNVSCVVSVTFDAKKTAGKTTGTVEMLKEKSTLVSPLYSGEVYKFFNLWIGNAGFASPSNIANPVINFKVEKAWIQNKNIDQTSIALNRYSDKKWEQIPVSLTGEDNNYLYFAAKTPGFSFFGITGKAITKETTEIKPEPNNQQNNLASEAPQNTATEQETETSDKISGFELIYGIVGLFAVFVYKRK